MYQDCKEILVQQKGKILVVKFNNPKKKNCVNTKAYKELGCLFRQVATDDSVTVVVITGEGEYFTSGNDLSQTPDSENVEAQICYNNAMFLEMVSSVIDCPKLIIALVNGPCIGIGTTLTAICDVTWVAEEAYFMTPFTKLGIVPEASSTYLMPLILGRSKATELLLLNEKLTAQEAYQFNLASKIFKLSELDSVIWPKIEDYAELPPVSLKVSKQLIRLHDRDSIYKALHAEAFELNKQIHSEEFLNAVLTFLTRKNKSKL